MVEIITLILHLNKNVDVLLKKGSKKTYVSAKGDAKETEGVEVGRYYKRPGIIVQNINPAIILLNIYFEIAYVCYNLVLSFISLNNQSN